MLWDGKQLTRSAGESRLSIAPSAVRTATRAGGSGNVQELCCTLLAGAASLSSVSLAQRVQDPPGKPFNYLEAGAVDSTSGPIHHNTSATDHIVIEGSYMYTRYDLVTGAVEAGPPSWTTPFGTLFNNSDLVTREYAKILPPHKSGRVFDKLLTNEGTETWSNGSNAFARDRTVWTVSKIKFLKTWDHGTPEPGG